MTEHLVDGLSTFADRFAAPVLAVAWLLTAMVIIGVLWLNPATSGWWFGYGAVIYAFGAQGWKCCCRCVDAWSPSWRP